MCVLFRALGYASVTAGALMEFVNQDLLCLSSLLRGGFHDSIWLVLAGFSLFLLVFLFLAPLSMGLWPSFHMVLRCFQVSGIGSWCRARPPGGAGG